MRLIYLMLIVIFSTNAYSRDCGDPIFLVLSDLDRAVSPFGDSDDKELGRTSTGDYNGFQSEEYCDIIRAAAHLRESKCVPSDGKKVVCMRILYEAAITSAGNSFHSEQITSDYESIADELNNCISEDLDRKSTRVYADGRIEKHSISSESTAILKLDLCWQEEARLSEVELVIHEETPEPCVAEEMCVEVGE